MADEIFEPEYTPDDKKATIEDFDRELAKQSKEFAVVTPVETETPVETPETPVEAETPVTETPAQIPMELLARAVRAGIDEEDIAEMNQKELNRAIRQAERTANEIRALREEMAKATKAPGPVDPDEDLLKTLDDETLVDPTIAKPIKALFAKLKGLEAKQRDTEPALQATQANSVRQRIEGHLSAIDAGLSKQFDNSAKGQRAWNDLMQQMQAQFVAERDSGNFVDESVRLQRALRALDLMPSKKEAKKEVPVEVKERYTNGALAKGSERQGEKSIIDIIKEKRLKWKSPDTEVRVDAEDKEPADFLPG